MPEHLRALVVILVISSVVFALAKSPITALACSEQDFVRRRNLWFALTLSAFLAHNFWLFAIVAAAAAAVAVRSESNRFALYMGIMLALPWLSKSIPAFGLVNELFTVDQLRLLALFLLLPTYLVLRKQPGVEPFGQLLCDKLLLCYFGLEFALALPYGTLTNLLREKVLYVFLDTFLIYYVASRSLRTVRGYRDALGAFVVGAMVFAATTAFESWRGWLLYISLPSAIGMDEYTGVTYPYLSRAGLLRATATGGHAIVAGYTCAIALGLYLYLRTLVPNIAWRHLGMVLLIAGLVGALSRAPWVGAAAMIVLFALLGTSPIASVAKLALAVLALLPLLVMTESGARIVDFLPWVGTVDASNVEFRENLTTVGVQVILNGPLFGHHDIAAVPAIEALRGGDGMIDLVNTYLIIGLRGGLPLLALFVGVMAVSLWGVCVAMRKIVDKRDERHVLGRSLLATLVGVLLIIGTMSPIFFVYPLLWILVGLAVGYVRMVEQTESRLESSVAGPRQGIQFGRSARR